MNNLSLHWLVFVLALLAGCKPAMESAEKPGSTVPTVTLPTSVPTETPAMLELPAGLPEVVSPATNLLTKEKIELGKRLFFDKNLSADRTMSCATCHDPEKGWSNGEAVAIGIHGEAGNRNVPTIINVAFNRRQFWDGRVSTLEQQALGPILNPIEMAMPSEAAIVERVSEMEAYRELFAGAFADGITATNIARAISCFERTVLVGDAPIDQYLAGDEDALSEAAKRGWTLYRRKARCNGCHPAPNFTDDLFHNLGVGTDKEDVDVGFMALTSLELHWASFKTPTLRNIAQTGPYMHDGSMKTLDEVIEFYNKGGLKNKRLDIEMWKNGNPNLTEEEKADLKQFMIEGLTSAQTTPVASK